MRKKVTSALAQRLFAGTFFVMLGSPGILSLLPEHWAPVAWTLKQLEAPALVGVPPSETPSWRWSEWLNGDLQRQLRDKFADQLAGRPLTIRAVNQVYYDVFARSHAYDNNILVGKNDVLYEVGYVRAFCQAKRADSLAKVEKLAEALSSINQALQARRDDLLVVITPSKASTQPEDIDVTICRHDPAITQLHSRFVAMLNAAQVSLVDGPTLVLQAALQDPLPPFPRGGTHWSKLIIDRAAQNALAGLSEAAEENLGTYEIGAVDWSSEPEGSDNDLARLLNLSESPFDYATARAAIRCQTSAAGKRHHLLMIGTSFSGQIAGALSRCDFFADVTLLRRYKQFQETYDKGTRQVIADPFEPTASAWASFLAPPTLVVIEVHEDVLNGELLFLGPLLKDIATALSAP